MISEGILNLIWAVTCLMAVAILIGSEYRYPYGRGSLARLRRDFAFLVIIVALFFCVSANDDLIRIRAYFDPSSHQPVVHLARELDLQEDVQAAAFYRFVLALCLLAILALPDVSLRQRFLPSPFGRSPPLLPAVR